MKSIRLLFEVLARFGKLRAVALLLMLLVNSVLEGLGIATLLPLLFVAVGQDPAEQKSPVARIVAESIEKLGLPLDLPVLATLAAGLLILRELVGFLIRTYAGFVAADITTAFRRRMLELLSCADWSYFQNAMTGGLNVSLLQFTAAGARSMEIALQTATIGIRTAIYAVMIILLSGPLAFYVFLATVTLFAPLFILVRLTRKYSRKMADATTDLGSQFTDTYASIKPIKAMGLEHVVQPLFHRYVRRLNRLMHKLVLIGSGLQALQSLAAIILVFGILALALSWLKMSIVEIGVMAGLMLTIAKGFTRFQNNLQKVANTEPFLSRLESLLTEMAEACERKGGRPAPALKKGITFKNVCFSYPKKTVFRDLNLFLPARKISVIMGPSGVGKTTIIDLIIGLYSPQEGTILIDDVPLSEIDLQDWRKHIGYVPQELVLLAGSVRDNITLGQAIDDDQVWEALRLAGAANFVRTLPDGLNTEIGERGLKLSGGQRQRLSLARALVRKPRLLILDEVTSALDPQTEAALVDQVAHLVRERGITVVSVTHTQAWKRVADRLIEVTARGVRETVMSP